MERRRDIPLKAKARADQAPSRVRRFPLGSRAEKRDEITKEPETAVRFVHLGKSPALMGPLFGQ